MAEMRFDKMADRYWRAIRKNKKNIPVNALHVVTAMPSLIKDLRNPEINLTDQGKKLLIEYAEMMNVPKNDPELYNALNGIEVH